MSDIDKFWEKVNMYLRGEGRKLNNGGNSTNLRERPKDVLSYKGEARNDARMRSKNDDDKKRKRK